MAEECVKYLLPSSIPPLWLPLSLCMASSPLPVQTLTMSLALVCIPAALVCYHLLLTSVPHILPSAVDIGGEGEFGSDDGSDPTPCVASNENVPDTIYLEPTDLPLPGEPCSNTQNTDSSTGEILTVVLPIALFSIVVCAVIVGIGVLSCYIIVSKKLQRSK